MLIRVADWLTRRAKASGSIRTLKAAWLVRTLASWFRGGPWRSFASLDAAAERVARQSLPRVPIPFVLVDEGDWG